MPIVEKIIKNAIATNFLSLPNYAVISVKKSLIDTLGCMLAGSKTKVGNVATMQYFLWGGKEESSVFGTDRKLPSHNAAFLNSLMAGSLEIDDCEPGPIHPSVSTIPACLALSEAVGNINGEQFITSVALGHDIIVRMALANKQTFFQTGRHNMFKIFGPAIACSKILSQESVETLNTLGLAYSQMVGDSQGGLEGALSLRFQQGHVARTGVVSAIFGGHGVTGAKDFLQGKYGYYNAFDTEPNLDKLIKDLGKEFYGKFITIKPYACCRLIHPAIDCILKLKEKYNLTKNELSKINISVNTTAFDIVCKNRSLPFDISDAQFNLTYNVACAMFFGDAFLSEYRSENFSSDEISQLMSLITIEKKKECDINLLLGKTIVEIETKAGIKVTAEQDDAKGSYNYPMHFKDCVTKFEKCVKYKYGEITSQQSSIIEQIIDCIDKLECEKNITTLTDLMNKLHHSYELLPKKREVPSKLNNQAGFFSEKKIEPLSEEAMLREPILKGT